MTRVVRRHAVCLLAALTLSVGSAIASGRLIVHFEGISKDSGSIVASLVDSEHQFLSREHAPRRSHSASIIDGKATWAIENLAFGKYAISAYHDVNSNAELDTGLFGIPTEDYGFSNNARAGFGAPDYADAEFEFSQDGQILTIRID